MCIIRIGDNMNDVNYLISNGVDVESGIELLGDLETYNETLQEFLRLSNDKLTNLINYKNANDFENYSIFAHSLKSDARYLGFIKLSEIALNHETKSKAKDIEFINSDFENFVNEVNRIRTVAINYLGTTASETTATAAPAPAPAAPAPAEVPTQTNTVVNQSNPNTKALLVVDDSQMIIDFITRALNGLYEVIVANDGKKAIEILENDSTNRIQGLFLDLVMPKFNGFDVLNVFEEKEWFDKYPVSIITGADDRESIDKAFKYPIVDMLVKPFTEDDVRRIVERTVSSKQN